MKAKILVYQMEETKKQKLTEAVRPMGIKVISVTEAMLPQTVEDLAEEKVCVDIASEEPSFATGGGEFLVMCGFSQLQFQLVMDLFQRKKVPKVPVKAMMTETNRNWPFGKLLQEVWQEHREMTGKN